ncbi:hypothetical protein ABG067_008423, partial [Albugo candida]
MDPSLKYTYWEEEEWGTCGPTEDGESYLEIAKAMVNKEWVDHFKVNNVTVASEVPQSVSAPLRPVRNTYNEGSVLYNTYQA